MERPEFDTDHVQAIRNNIANLIEQLDTIASEQPNHGQYITFAKNHLRMGFMELGYGSALTKGLNPLANKVE